MKKAVSVFLLMAVAALMLGCARVNAPLDIAPAELPAKEKRTEPDSFGSDDTRELQERLLDIAYDYDDEDKSYADAIQTEAIKKFQEENQQYYYLAPERSDDGSIPQYIRELWERLLDIAFDDE